MSLYQLQKLIYHVNRDSSAARTVIGRIRRRSSKIMNSPMTEAKAALDVDVRALYSMGVHSLLLRPFTLLHKVSNEDYAKALKGLE